MNTVCWTDLGRLEYGRAWRLQQALVAERKAGRGADRLLLVEHEPVVTLGRRAQEAHLLVGREGLRQRGIPVFSVERGGDVTYHGPGQLVAYPILDLRGYRKDVRWYSQALLEVVVRTLAGAGICGEPGKGLRTGVWVDVGGPEPAKIAALGVRIEQWVTYHGIALNVATGPDPFELIVPCGLAGARTVAMADVLGRPIGVDEVQPMVLAAFGTVFGVALEAAALPAAEAA